MQLLEALLRRKIMIISVCALTAVLSGGYSLTRPNIYAAYTKVLPPQKDGGGLSSMLGQMGGLAGLAGGGGKGGDNDLYLSILKSRSVGVAVIERLNLSQYYHAKGVSGAWKLLNAAVSANSTKDGIITITAEDTDPKHAALLANTMVDELSRTLIRMNLTKAGSERLFLEKRLEVVKKDLAAAEEDLKTFSERNKIVQVEAQTTATISNISRLKTDIATREVQLATLRTSRSDDSYEVKEAVAAIKGLKKALASAAGSAGGGEGVPPLGEMPSVGLEYGRKLRLMKTQEALYEQLTKQYEMAKINEAKDSSSLQVLDEAVPPEEKVRPKRATLVLMATVIAFMGSVALALVLEYLEHLSPEEHQVLRRLKELTFSLRGN